MVPQLAGGLRAPSLSCTFPGCQNAVAERMFTLRCIRSLQIQANKLVRTENVVPVSFFAFTVLYAALQHAASSEQDF